MNASRIRCAVRARATGSRKIWYGASGAVRSPIRAPTAHSAGWPRACARSRPRGKWVGPPIAHRSSRPSAAWRICCASAGRRHRLCLVGSAGKKRAETASVTPVHVHPRAGPLPKRTQSAKPWPLVRREDQTSRMSVEHDSASLDGSGREPLKSYLAERGGQAPRTMKSNKNQRLNTADEISVYQQLCTSQACNRFQICGPRPVGLAHRSGRCVF